jgi:hypothetical protein
MDLWYFSLSEMNVASVLYDYNYKFTKHFQCKLINHTIISNGVHIIIILFFETFHLIYQITKVC